MVIVRYAGPDGPAYGSLQEHVVHALDGDPFSAPLDAAAAGPVIGGVEEMRLLAP